MEMTTIVDVLEFLYANFDYKANNMTVEELKSSVIDKDLCFIFKAIREVAMDGRKEIYYKLSEDETIKSDIIEILTKNGFTVSKNHDRVVYHDRVKISWTY